MTREPDDTAHVLVVDDEPDVADTQALRLDVVIMLTAVDPDLNILELAFDDSLQKPVDRETLLATLAQRLDGRGADDRLDGFFRITSKRRVLEAETLDDSSEYGALQARAEELEAQLRAEMDDFETVVETYRSIRRESECPTGLRRRRRVASRR